jgi:hypothetical protein
MTPRDFFFTARAYPGTGPLRLQHRAARGRRHLRSGPPSAPARCDQPLSPEPSRTRSR